MGGRRGAEMADFLRPLAAAKDECDGAMPQLAKVLADVPCTFPVAASCLPAHGGPACTADTAAAKLCLCSLQRRVALD